MFNRMRCLSVLAVGLGLLVASNQVRADDKKVDLNVGDAAPSFQLSDDHGKPWKSGDHFKKKFVVVYFYPGDFTPGCMAQANKYRDTMNSLVDKGVEVVGMEAAAVSYPGFSEDIEKLLGR